MAAPVGEVSGPGPPVGGKVGGGDGEGGWVDGGALGAHGDPFRPIHCGLYRRDQGALGRCLSIRVAPGPGDSPASCPGREEHQGVLRLSAWRPTAAPG